MKAIRVTQLVWSAFLLFGLVIEALGGGLIATEALLLLAVLYVFIAVLAVGTNRIVWATALTMPALLFATEALRVLSVMKDRSQYPGSVLATYLVVVDTLLFVLPCLILYTLFWRHRMTLRSLFIQSSRRLSGYSGP